ncbi:hypothetical protein C3B51_02520 [Pseudoalteromonas rubra]|uniref:Solute-binding protein family 3/N-terminal domain-containing protein n=1 Tax=Pseudoalteromonas rubra TaxID=43658 RepID=A0A4Q7EMR7_9GAMM|nr:hypothetical protein [Pseudoalteromonas rubra]RZM84710.1 hypothetical protein C3B51_02520 [Pseudoalteromonas rubra]
MKYVLIVCVLLAWTCQSQTHEPDTVATPKYSLEITLPIRQVKLQKYISELLHLALAELDYELVLTMTPNPLYMRESRLLNSGRITMIMRLATPERDASFHKIDVPLTQGLIGKRLLLIHQRHQARFDTIDSLDSLRSAKLTGVFAPGWYDSQIWQANKLPYIESASDHTTILRMLIEGNRGFDYFSRGINEIDDYELSNGVIIEPRLILSYPLDFHFYLHRANTVHISILTRALTQARDSGLQTKLLNKHFGYLLKRHQVSKRRLITLALPTPEAQTTPQP